MEKRIEVDGLGLILLRTSPRAKNYSIKIKNGEIIATMPIAGKEDFMLSFINSKREKLLILLEEKPPQTLFLNENTQLETHSFKVHIFRTARKNFYMSLKEGILHIACPQDTDFRKEEVQNLLKRFLQKALRYEANRLLPPRLAELAHQYNFSYSQVKINGSKTRWGSCSQKKSINLSFYLMMLPERLITYVLLHELCHTIEMNHQESFWRLMNRVTENQALELRDDLKKQTIVYL